MRSNYWRAVKKTLDVDRGLYNPSDALALSELARHVSRQACQQNRLHTWQRLNP
jgi:hypothetical protein